jgi:hypothetical protein
MNTNQAKEVVKLSKKASKRSKQAIKIVKKFERLMERARVEALSAVHRTIVKSSQ